MTEKLSCLVYKKRWEVGKLTAECIQCPSCVGKTLISSECDTVEQDGGLQPWRGFLCPNENNYKLVMSTVGSFCRPLGAASEGGLLHPKIGDQTARTILP